MLPGRPTRVSIVPSGIRLFTVAVPVRLKLRAVGRVNSRLKVGSRSDRGGIGATRCRLITMASRCDCEEAPAAVSRSDGMETTSWASVPPSSTAARPTGEAFWMMVGDAPTRLVRSIVIRSVLKLRLGKLIV